MTIYEIMRRGCGLSIKEAAFFHGVTEKTVKSWCSSKRPMYVPIADLDKLKSLAKLQRETAADILERVKISEQKRKKRIEPTPALVITMLEPQNDAQAIMLGYPCIGAWALMAAMIIVSSPVRVTFSSSWTDVEKTVQKEDPK